MVLLAVEVQDGLQSSCCSADQQPARKKRKAPVCRKCNKPMKNHSRVGCAGASNTLSNYASVCTKYCILKGTFDNKS